MRHADAGYEEAIATAAERGVDLPMINAIGEVGSGNRQGPTSRASPHQHCDSSPRCRAGAARATSMLVRDAALAWEGDRIRWVGPLGGSFRVFASAAGSRMPAAAPVFPGLIDCHTHLAFGGWRADEFEQRIQGATYLDIAPRRRRHRLHRSADARRRPTLTSRRVPRLSRRRCGSSASPPSSPRAATVSTGTPSCGCSGLPAPRSVAAARIVPTYLGAHVVPPEYKDDRAGYLRLVIDEMIPEIARGGPGRVLRRLRRELGVHRRGGPGRFSRRGVAAGLRPKLHADQLSDGGGALLAAEVGALSRRSPGARVGRRDRAPWRPGRCRGRQPAARVPVPEPAADAGARLIEAGVSRRGRHRLQPGLGAELPPAARADAGLHPAADDTGRGVEGRHASYAARALGREAEVGSLEAGK